MRWSIVGLVSLGFFAALCAVVLLIINRPAATPVSAPPVVESAPEPVRVPILVAARTLGQHHALQFDDLEVRQVTEDLVPKRALNDPVQAIGRVLRLGLAQGAAVTEETLATSGSSVHLAASITQGRRAATVLVDIEFQMQGLLYPGAFVDVIAALDLQSNTLAEKQPVSVTLLNHVMVLRIEGKTMVEPDGEPDSGSAGSRSTQVTLLVTPEEAERLALAQEKGTLGLVLRNPLDTSVTPPKGTRLADVSPLFMNEAAASNTEGAEAARMAKLTEDVKARIQGLFQADLDKTRAALEEARALRSEAESASAAGAARAEPATWSTVILRGDKRETKEFAVPVNGSDQ